MFSKPGKFCLTFTPTDGSGKQEVQIFDFKGPGVGLGMYNTDEVSLFILFTPTDI